MALHIGKTIKRILAGIGEKSHSSSSSSKQADKQNKQEMLEQ